MKKFLLGLLISLCIAIPSAHAVNFYASSSNATDLDCVDCVGDAEIDWGTGAGQVSFADIPGDFSELQTATPSKTLVNEEDAATIDAAWTFDNAVTVNFGGTESRYVRVSEDNGFGLPTIADEYTLIVDNITTGTGVGIGIIGRTNTKAFLHFGDNSDADEAILEFDNAVNTWGVYTKDVYGMTFHQDQDLKIETKDCDGNCPVDGHGADITLEAGDAEKFTDSNGGSIRIKLGAKDGTGDDGALIVESSGSNRFITGEAKTTAFTQLIVDYDHDQALKVTKADNTLVFDIDTNNDIMTMAALVSCPNLQTNASGEFSCNSTDYIEESELDTFAELQAQIADKTLVNEEDAVTWDSAHSFSSTVAIGTASALGELRVHDTSGESAVYITSDANDNAIIWLGTDVDGTAPYGAIALNHSVDEVQIFNADGFARHIAITNTGIVEMSEGLGLGATHVSGTRLTLPQETDAVTPTLAFGDGDSGFYETADDSITVAIAGVENWKINGSGLSGTKVSDSAIINLETASATNPTFSPSRSDTDTGLGWAAADQLSLVAGGVEGVRVTEAAGEIQVIIQDTNTGANAGTDACLDANGALCACGSCA